MGLTISQSVPLNIELQQRKPTRDRETAAAIYAVKHSEALLEILSLRQMETYMGPGGNCS